MVPGLVFDWYVHTWDGVWFTVLHTVLAGKSLTPRA
jgi:hypothetical protein